MPTPTLGVQYVNPNPGSSDYPPQPGSSSARPGNNKRFRFLLLTRIPQAGHVLSRSWNVGKERHSNQYINVKQDQEHCMFQQNIKIHKKTIYPLLKFEFQFVMVYFALWLLSHITRWRSLRNQCPGSSSTYVKYFLPALEAAHMITGGLEGHSGITLAFTARIT